jgi:nucleotidyltransferase AbiEii toxin of type IV toxin-antitoxin system
LKRAFLHNEADFVDLIQVVAAERRLAPSLVEKDYWVAFCLAELVRSKWGIYFKGGTSLSKGFQIIERFSEDLDLKLIPPHAAGRTIEPNWKATSRAATQQRAEYFDRLVEQLKFPDCRVVEVQRDHRQRSVDVRVEYPSTSGALPAPLKAGVLLEIGNARVTPCELRAIDSWLMQKARGSGFESHVHCQPVRVDCVLPEVTLLEKLDAIARQYGNVNRSAAGFVRHYEDAASIIQFLNARDSWSWSGLADLNRAMREARDIRVLDFESDAFRLPATDRSNALERAWRDAASLHWGQRITLQAAVGLIHKWVRPALEGAR